MSISEDLLRQILAQQVQNGKTMSRIEVLLELALLRDKHPNKDELFNIAEEGGGLDCLMDAKNLLLFLSKNRCDSANERHEDLRRELEQEYNDDWQFKGYIDCYVTWAESNDSEKIGFWESATSGSIKMSEMKEMFYKEFAAPRNATDLNKILISKVKHYIKEGKLPDAGIFKKINGSEPKGGMRYFPSRSTLSKDDVFRFWMLYSLTWGHRA